LKLTSLGLTAALLNRLVKKDFHSLFTLSVVSPKGGELKEGSQLFRRVLKPRVVASSKRILFQHPGKNPPATVP
jgi:hypothetical protein